MMPPIGLRNSGITRHKTGVNVNFVNYASKGGSTVSSISPTYSPTNGNYIFVFLGIKNPGGTVTCVDSSSNSLTAGPTTTLTNAYGYSFYYQVPSTGITGFTVNWSGGTSDGWANVIEYSGVASVNASLSGNTNSATGTNPNITCTTLVNKSWLVVGFVDSSTTSWTSPTGNLRIGNTTSPSSGRSAVMDNTSATAGSVTCSITKSLNATWVAMAFELDP
jgi:hypothetical protein